MNNITTAMAFVAEAHKLDDKEKHYAEALIMYNKGIQEFSRALQVPDLPPNLRQMAETQIQTIQARCVVLRTYIEEMGIDKACGHIGQVHTAPVAPTAPLGAVAAAAAVPHSEVVCPTTTTTTATTTTTSGSSGAPYVITKTTTITNTIETEDTPVDELFRRFQALNNRDANMVIHRSTTMAPSVPTASLMPPNQPPLFNHNSIQRPQSAQYHSHHHQQQHQHQAHPHPHPQTQTHTTQTQMLVHGQQQQQQHRHHELMSGTKSVDANIDFLTPAIDTAKEALKKDAAKQYKEAEELYAIAIDCFNTHLKFESDPMKRASITRELNEIVKRSDEIRKYLEKVERQKENRIKPTSQGYVDFTGQAAASAKRAIELDTARNYSQAYVHYQRTVDLLEVALKYTAADDARAVIRTKIEEYSNRAIEIKNYLGRR